MNTSVHKTLDNIMKYCLKRHQDRMIPLYKCLDIERIVAFHANITSENNKIEESSIGDTYFLVIDTYATAVLSFIGIILNIVGSCQLMRKSERNKLFSSMLSVILLFDIFYLVFKLMKGLEIYMPVPAENLRLYRIITDSGVRFSLTSSILMMVAIARVRYQAILKPIRQRILFLSRKKRMKEIYKYLIPALVVSFTFTFPISWEIDGVPFQNDNIYPISTLYQSPPSTTRLNPFYSFWVLGLLNFGFLGAVPCVSLMYYAHKIMIFTNNRPLINRQSSNSRRIMDANTKKISKSLVAIIFTFVTLHSPRIVTSLGELIVLTMPNKNDLYLNLGYGFPAWLQIIAPISDLCIVLNASLTIIIYKLTNSVPMPEYFSTSIPNYFRMINSAVIPSSLPTIGARQTEADGNLTEIPSSLPINIDRPKHINSTHDITHP